MELEVIPGAVPTAELEVGGTVTAHERWPWQTDETTQTGQITAIRREPNGMAAVTVNDVEFLAFPPGEPGPVWFTDYDPPPPPPMAEPDVPPPPDDNPPAMANAAAAAEPAEEEEDVLSSLEPSPMPSRDSPVGEEPTYENPAPKSAPTTPLRPPRKGGKRTRKHRTPRRKRNAVRKSTYRVSRRR